MNTAYLDLSLLTTDSDTRVNFIHAKIKRLSKKDLDLDVIGKLAYSKNSIADWLKGRHPVPLPVLKNPNNIANRIEYLCLRASKARVLLPICNKKLAYFLGVVFGDGHIANSVRSSGYRRFKVVIQKGRSDYSEFVIPKIIENVFGIRPRLFFSKRKSELITVSINSKIVSRFFTQLFNFTYGKKSDRVIDSIKTLSPELQFYFIAGLFDTDGGISGDSFAFCNSSKKTTRFVEDFLNLKNIETRFYKQSKGRFKWYQVRIPRSNKNKFLLTFPLKNKRKFATGET